MVDLRGRLEATTSSGNGVLFAPGARALAAAAAAHNDFLLLCARYTIPWLPFSQAS